jgi:hypothetical protein
VALCPNLTSSHSLIALLAIAALSGCSGNEPSPSLDPTRVPVSGSARRALLVAEVAATTWMADAQLLYAENDATPGVDGRSPAWGFLFYSENAGAWWNVAVREGQVVHEGLLSFPYAAPPLPREWIDSDRAAAIADGAAGADFCDQANGELRHLVLSRGVFHDVDGAPTWTVVYRSPTRGELAVIVDAESGTVLGEFEG